MPIRNWLAAVYRTKIKNVAWLMNLLGLLFIGLAAFQTIVLHIGMFVYGHPFDPGSAMGLAALAAAGVVASLAAHCLKNVEARLDRIEIARGPPDKNPK